MPGFARLPVPLRLSGYKSFCIKTCAVCAEIECSETQDVCLQECNSVERIPACLHTWIPLAPRLGVNLVERYTTHSADVQSARLSRNVASHCSKGQKIRRASAQKQRLQHTRARTQDRDRRPEQNESEAQPLCGAAHPVHDTVRPESKARCNVTQQMTHLMPSLSGKAMPSRHNQQNP